MRFKLIGKENSRTVKRGFFGMFAKVETEHEFTMIPSQESLKYVKNTKSAYDAHFGSFQLFSVAKGIAARPDSRFSIVGFFLNNSGETPESAVFVKASTLSEISALWNDFTSNELASKARMMRSVVVKDNLTNERILINAYFAVELEFKDTADADTITAFSNVFLEVSHSIIEDSYDEMDRLFVKALEKSREEKNLSL